VQGGQRNAPAIPSRAFRLRGEYGCDPSELTVMGEYPFFTAREPAKENPSSAVLSDRGKDAMQPYGRIVALLFTVLLSMIDLGHTQPRNQERLVLFAPREAEQLRFPEDAWQVPPRTRSLQVGPRIVIQHPQVTDSNNRPIINTISPTDFFVVFEANRTPVDMESLCITAKKGPFSKSLTDQLRPYIQGTSLRAEAVTIPAGRFLIQIEIADQGGAKTDGHYLLQVRER
jgi:hypothetical protein